MKALFNVRSVVMLVLMLLSVFAAQRLKPIHYMSEESHKQQLDAIVPHRFGAWVEDTQDQLNMPVPEQDAEVKLVYQQTLSRIYRDAQGDRVFLVIAVGGEQSRAMQVHRPEVCYASQGFTIVSKQKFDLSTPYKTLHSMRVVTSRQDRTEPLMYWVRIGNRLVAGNIEQGLARVGYGLRGIIPDGLLFRVSTWETDTDHSYAVQERFVRDLLAAMPAQQRDMLIGN